MGAWVVAQSVLALAQLAALGLLLYTFMAGSVKGLEAVAAVLGVVVLLGVFDYVCQWCQRMAEKHWSER